VLNCADEQWARDLNVLADDIAARDLRVVVLRGAGRVGTNRHNAAVRAPHLKQAIARNSASATQLARIALHKPAAH